MRCRGKPDESDLNVGTLPFGLYPIPANRPIEDWPSQTGAQTVTQWQTNDDGSDRHSIIVQSEAGLIFELWRALRVSTNWGATNGAIFNLNTDALRLPVRRPALRSMLRFCGAAAGFRRQISQAFRVLVY